MQSPTRPVSNGWVHDGTPGIIDSYTIHVLPESCMSIPLRHYYRLLVLPSKPYAPLFDVK